MGNCSFKGFDTCLDPVRVMTSSGQVLEFNGPKLVSEVVKDFPRHGIFRKDQLSSPLDHRELLIGGQFYHLFPLTLVEERDQSLEEKVSSELEPVRISSIGVVGPVITSASKDSEVPDPVSDAALGLIDAEPVRISTRTVALQIVTKNLSDGSGFEVLPPSRKGIWKVKLLINTKQLEEILLEEANTEALIEQMRVAAASATRVVPRQRKGYWGMKLKPTFCNTLNKTEVDDSWSPKSVTPLLH